ncbi:hypothetical protein FOS14_18850 [Skermania sp. ID1734]|uniref:hypothetical protein n=1 Tax=Skermania sp. ID1734 TaxID=2597516 RepID=UPI00117EED78|nr:hypothetical protein [Skermania sp. ID1734]TSD95053.1 hypothetical protein FOS14_18850 [Skermania sp. ID1734]
MAVVYVVDTVVAKPGRAREFVDSYLAGYAPGAVDRGMALERIMVSPPLWLADESNTVTAIWALDGPEGWWKMTWQGRNDDTLGQWWAGVEALIEHRSRSVAAAAADVDGLANV